MTVPPRFTRRALPVLAALLVSTLATGTVDAQNPAPEAGTGWSQQETQRVAKEVQKKLANLSNYSVWDWITFGIRGNTVVLKGYAALPTLKSSAGNVVKSIHGVESVHNEIQVLPTSMIDNRIRVQVYDRIYRQPALRKYNANQGSYRRATLPGLRMPDSILYNPPMGLNTIHIIVRNSHVALYGVVDGESDKSIAGLQAKSVPGVFSVENHLIVAHGGSKKNK